MLKTNIATEHLLDVANSLTVLSNRASANVSDDISVSRKAGSGDRII